MSSIGPVSEWASTLANHRNWVKGWIANEQTAAQFDTDWSTKLQVVAAVAGQLELDATSAWQALGVVFGDALSLATGLPWGEVTDQYGTDPCIVVNAAKDALAFPLTMLSKRAEKGERLDQEMIFRLFQQVVDNTQQLAVGP
jgi:hypothetical protein